MSIYENGVEGTSPEPVSINGVSAFTITVAGGGKRTIQPVFFTKPALLANVMYSKTAAHPGATLALLKPTRCIAHMGCEAFVGVGTYYIHGITTDAAGTVTVGGALDTIYSNQEST
jgi:hypothetical protein